MAKDRVSFKDKSLPELNKKKVNSAQYYIDIDTTILEPSPQRIRNILTLEERVAAIEAYDCRPMYTKVAKMFNCSWEQIKNIIANREAIMEFYQATRAAETQNDPNRLEVRARKISFLGECLYEYLQRAQFHIKSHINEELLRVKAMEFRDIMHIDNFIPNKAWINHFKATYNFSLSNRQITITRTPPHSLDLKDIMTYCTKNKTKVEEAVPTATRTPVEVNKESSDLYRTTTRIAVADENEAAMQEMKQRRLRKMNFLMKALFEYTNRAKYHQKMKMDENSLRKVACELKEMLKIDHFHPDKEWLNLFITVTYPTMLEEMPFLARSPPLSLDLKDILSYCGRQEHKRQAPSTITLTPKEQGVPVKSAAIAATSPTTQTPLVQIHTFNLRRSDESATSTTRTTRTSPTIVKQALACKIKEEVIDLDVERVANKEKNAMLVEAEDEEERDVKPNLSDLPARPKTPAAPAKSNEVQPMKALVTTVPTNPPTTVVVAMPDEARKSTSASCSSTVPALRVVSLNELVPPQKAASPTPATTTLLTTSTIVSVKDAQAPSRTMQQAHSRAAQATTIAAVSEVPAASNTNAQPKRPNSNTNYFPHQPLKIQKMESMVEPVIQTAHSPGHWSEHSDHDEEELPKHVTNYKDALKLLKPLEEFAMLEENYRVIGLISQLEEIFKHPPKKDDS